MKYVLFGAGEYGHKAVQYLGKDNVDFFVDNFKEGISEDGIVIYKYSEAKKNILRKRIIITTSNDSMEKISKQLLQDGISFISYADLQKEVAKKNRESKQDFLSIYKNAIRWIKNNSNIGEGISVSNINRKSYPEVTGYYIPTLLRWGYRETAVSYAKWLITIQKEDGSWFDSDDKDPYIFDSAQIIKGLLAIRMILPSVDEAIIKGCNWILSCMNEQGRLITPSKASWGSRVGVCDEVIHLYCLSPLIEAGNIFMKPQYIEAAKNILDYYKSNYYDEIINFSLLSHFYAYVIEGLIDLDEIEMAELAMDNIESFQKEDGAVPGLNNVSWVCSVGLFQLALIWFRLGNISRGNKAFEYACGLQNANSGWYGSYLYDANNAEDNFYFPNSEISWTIKFFLDALYYKKMTEFDLICDDFLTDIDREDGRYKIIFDELKKLGEEKHAILDVGCGKGRYLNNLKVDLPNNTYAGVDISEKILSFIDDKKTMLRQGSITNIPFENDVFDFTYSCEVLEHAIDIESAISEMARVTHKGGKIIIIDKNIECQGRLEVDDWEQWFDVEELKNIIAKYCSTVSVYKNVKYEKNKMDGLFCAWIGTVNR
ncbi:methyltransferase domain-containing protein [Butyrivibrio sp. AE3006]|uniref:methyltransferase domain-containing protein n=1 Tax=Butyrivibrio sp. AE3006 TaxID=1280673 RepID=UPI0004282E90|nr:methyltransferase domain-containing protein [Butyrivibrio sp. AE3006]